MANPFGTPVRFIPDDTYGGGEFGPAHPSFYGPDFYDGAIYAAHGDADCIIEPIDNLCGVRNLWKTTDAGETWERSTDMYGTSSILWGQSNGGSNPHAIVNGVYYIFEERSNAYRVSKWDIDAGSGTYEVTTFSDYYVNNGPGNNVGDRVRWRFAVARGTDIYLFFCGDYNGSGWPTLDYVVYDTSTDTFGTRVPLNSNLNAGSFVIASALNTSDNSIHIIFQLSDRLNSVNGSIDNLYHISLSSGDAASSPVEIDSDRVEGSGSTVYVSVNTMLQIGQVGGIQTLAICYESNERWDTPANPESGNPSYNWYQRVAFSQDDGATWTVENLPYDSGDATHFRWVGEWITNHYGNPGRGIAIFNDTLYAFTTGMRDDTGGSGIVTDTDYTSRIFVHERAGANDWSIDELFTEDSEWQTHSVHFNTDGSSAGIVFMTSGLDADLIEGPNGYHTLNLRSYWSLFTVEDDDDEDDNEGPANCDLITPSALSIDVEIDDEPTENNVRLYTGA